MTARGKRQARGGAGRWEGLPGCERSWRRGSGENQRQFVAFLRRLLRATAMAAVILIVAVSLMLALRWVRERRHSVKERQQAGRLLYLRPHR